MLSGLGLTPGVAGILYRPLDRMIGAALTLPDMPSKQG
jgi:hypothetical protein